VVTAADFLREPLDITVLAGPGCRSFHIDIRLGWTYLVPLQTLHLSRVVGLIPVSWHAGQSTPCKVTIFFRVFMLFIPFTVIVSP